MMTRGEMMEAQRQLRIDGWRHVMSVMDDLGGYRFGLLYSKGEQEFWLNLHTFRDLPISARQEVTK